MTTSISDSIDAYLDHHAAREDPLARMLRAPEAGRGTVHTPREIAQQPLLWRLTARQMADAAPALRAFLHGAGLYGGPGPEPCVLFVGAGTSDYVGMSTIDGLRERLGTDVAHVPTTRITPAPDVHLRPGRRYLVVHVARSGNSPESRAVLDLGLRRPAEDVRHLVLTCNADGALARCADEHPDRVHKIVLHDACNDRGLAMTSSFTSMVTAAQAFGHLDAMDAFVDRVDRTAASGETFLRAHAATLSELARRPFERVFFLGDDDLLGAATESALKVQELTAGRLIAKAEDTLAFRHGPISAVDGRSLVVFLLSADAHLRRYELDVVRQYQDAFADLGAAVAVVGAARSAEGLRDDVEVLSYDPDGVFGTPPRAEAPVAVLAGQLFGVFAAYHRGVDVDTPSAGHPLYSRTVQGVAIHPYPDAGATT